MLLGKLKKPVQDNGPEIIGHQILWGNAALAFNIKKLGTQSTFFTGFLGNFSQHGGGVFTIPKTLVNLPSHLWYAKFI